MDPRELVALGTLSVAMFDVGVTDVAQRLRVFGDARGLPAVVVAERPSGRGRPRRPPG